MMVGYWSINDIPACRTQAGGGFECSTDEDSFDRIRKALVEKKLVGITDVIEHHPGKSCPAYSENGRSGSFNEGYNSAVFSVVNKLNFMAEKNGSSQMGFALKDAAKEILKMVHRID